MKYYELKYPELLRQVMTEFDATPDCALILGSGLGTFAEKLEIIKSVSTSDLPGYPESTVPGHAGKIHLCAYANKLFLLFQGRIHLYEGYSIQESLLPVYLSHKLGCKSILLTNAAGGINSGLYPADLMLSSSFNAMNLKKVLSSFIGAVSIETKNALLDLTSAELNTLLYQAANEENIVLKEGIYWHTYGPMYETPAEIQMIKKFGGDAVGMSTVHEAIFARVLGMNVAAVSCITNYAAGISSSKLSHLEVIETANIAQDRFERLIKRFFQLL